MAKHLIIFGHSPNGSPDPGTTSGSLKEAIEVRKLEPFMKKWGDKSKDTFEFYKGNAYADRSITKQKGYDSVTEIHMDGPKGSGGHVIIFRGFKPDNIDLRLRDLIKRHWGIVGYLQSSNGFSRRSNLYNVNEAARVGINYRLLELFFMSNKAHHQHYIKNLDIIAKELIESISGKGIDGKAESTPDVKPAPKPSKPSTKATPLEVAKEIVSSNKWGNGDTRKRKLQAAGYDYNEVQGLVNDIVYKRSTPKPKNKSAEQVAQDIANGRGGWGNDPERSRKLNKAGYNAASVQRRVNEILRGSKPKSSSVNIESLAKQVVRGIDTKGKRIPNGVSARAKHFGISVATMKKVQKRVNQLLS